GFVRAWVNTYQTDSCGHGKWMSRAQAKPEHWVVSHAGFRGLYAVTSDEPDTRSLTRKVSKALSGGARIVQYRNKSATVELRREQGAALLALCREARIPLVINDDQIGRASCRERVRIT